MPRIRLIAGPNGAGKTTLLKTLVNNKVPVGQYINPDDIARHISLNSTLDRTNKELGLHPKSQDFPAEVERYLAVIRVIVKSGVRAQAAFLSD